MAAGEQAAKKKARAAVAGATYGLSELPGLNKLTSKVIDVGFDKAKARAVLAAKAASFLVAGLFLALIMSITGLAGITTLLGGGGFPLPDEPTAMQRVLMPPGHDPAERASTASTVQDMLTKKVSFTGVDNGKAVTQSSVPGWADVAYLGQEASVEASDNFGIPWTVLGGLMRVQSDFGRSSPYDAIDRNPSRDFAYGYPPGAEGSSGATSFADSFTGSVLLTGDYLLTNTSAQVAGRVPNPVSAAPASTLAQVIADMKVKPTIPDAVVVYAGPGEDAASFGSRIDALMKAVNKDTMVYGVTYWNPAAAEVSASLNDAWAAAARRHDNLTLIKWAGEANSADWFTADGTAKAGAGPALGRMVIKAISSMTSSAGWVIPIQGHYTPTAGFNQGGGLWSSGYHTGQDLADPVGTPVVAARAGRVTIESNGWAGPNYVKIDHGTVGKNNLTTTYAHMSKRFVNTGDIVKAGQKIGEVGALGNVTGPHLHLEVHVNGTPVDPNKYIPVVKNATAAGPGDSGRATVADTVGSDNGCPVPTLAIPIGGGKDEGVGPFLLMPEHAAAVTESGGDPQNPCDAAAYVGAKLAETGQQLFDSGDYDDWEDDDDVAKKLWSDTITASGLFADPNSGETDCAASVEDGAVGSAIEAIWTCEAMRAEHLAVVTEAVKGTDGTVDFSTVDGATGAAYLVSEAQTVAWNFSKYDLDKCDSTAPKAGIFPLTAAVASKYGAADRCDPVQNIRAAAQAVLAGEAVPVGNRPTDLGPFQPMLGGWASLGWALGSTAATFSRTGPEVTWTPSASCDAVAGTWLNSIQTTLAGYLDTLDPDLNETQIAELSAKVAAVPQPTRSGYCAQANASQWNQELALVAESTTPDTTGADAATARRYQVLSVYFASVSQKAVTVLKAVPGIDSMVDRLSVTEKSIATAKESAFASGAGDSTPVGPKAVEFAVGYGGIRPDWDTATEDVLEMAQLGGGVSAEGVASGDAATVIAAAKSQIGVPYSWGGGGPAGPSRGIAQGANIVGFDCSGLMQYAYSKVGVDVGGTTVTQVTKGTHVDGLKDALPGDLIFWPGHVALYLGNGQVVHAPHTGSFVKIVPVSQAHSGSPTEIRRILKPSTGSAVGFPATTKDAKALAARLQGVGGAGYAELFVTAGRRHNLDPALLAAVAMKESSYRPEVVNCANRSSAGALGIMQFMPGTAAGMGIDPCDPSSAIFGSGKYLRGLLNQFGSLDKALAAYNWGSGNVARKGLSGAPAETREYITKVPEYCRQFGGCTSS